jgi:hypothetical protein
MHWLRISLFFARFPAENPATESTTRTYAGTSTAAHKDTSPDSRRRKED